MLAHLAIVMLFMEPWIILSKKTPSSLCPLFLAHHTAGKGQAARVIHEGRTNSTHGESACGMEQPLLYYM